MYLDISNLKILLFKNSQKKCQNLAKTFFDTLPKDTAIRGVLCKFLEISQNSQENTCARVSF